MALVAPNLRAGYQGFAAAVNATGKLVSTTAITDPAEPSSASAVTLGLCNVPAFDQTEGFTPVESIGSMKDVGFVPGQRGSTVRVPIQVSDLTYFADSGKYTIIRKHALIGSGEGGLVNGLQLNHLFLGAGSVYSSAGYGLVGVDALVNSFALRIQERQAVMADIEFWPICFLNMATPLAQHVVPTSYASNPLHWGELSLVIGGNDYRNVLSGVNISVAQGLYRDGMRNLLPNGSGGELNISRTPIGIVPGVEKLTFGLTLKDRWPLTTSNWGTIVATAAMPVTGYKLVVTIANAFLNSQRLQTVAPGQPFQFSADASAFGITVVSSIV